ncbi:cupin domain-containing protein [Marivita sp.]|uniref:cupin domain-containing protein n=1 Tax=Marivita sp. TaxID=2003365 RepID=UPI0026260995|nr:cupin domain-containing protein [Marivita sp.]
MTEQMVPAYNWNDIPERELRRGLTQKVFRGNDVLIGYNSLHPGMQASPHSHIYEQIFMLLQGRVKLHVGDQVHDLKAGAVVRIPPNMEHWAEAPADADGVAINMDIWTPLRPDYGKYTDYQTDTFNES